MVRLDLLGLDPIRECPLEFALALRQIGSLPQCWNCLGFNAESQIVIFESADYVVLEQIYTGQIERQLVGRRARFFGLLQYVDCFGYDFPFGQQ